MPTMETTEAVNVRFQRSAVAVPKKSPWKTTGLILLSLVVSPMAVYLDGGSSLNVVLNFILWINLLWPISVPWAIGYVLRSDERRKMSRPWRYSLWVRHSEGYAPHSKVNTNEASSPGQDDSNAATARADENPFCDSRAVL